MYRKIALIAATFLIGSFNMSLAQDSRHFTAQPQHEALKAFEGQWTFERFAPAADGSAPQKLGAGTILTELLGEIFVVSKWSGEIYGIGYSGVQTLGYDVDSDAYSGTWIDNLMNYRWQLDGSLAPDSSEFTLATEGPAPDGSTGRFRERYRFDSPDAITVFAEMMQDGEWAEISTTRIVRNGTAQEASLDPAD